MSTTKETQEDFRMAVEEFEGRMEAVSSCRKRALETGHSIQRVAPSEAHNDPKLLEMAQTSLYLSVTFTNLDEKLTKYIGRLKALNLKQQPAEIVRQLEDALEPLEPMLETAHTALDAQLRNAQALADYAQTRTPEESHLNIIAKANLDMAEAYMLIADDMEGLSVQLNDLKDNFTEEE